MNEEEMNKEMNDLQEINLELEVLTQTTELLEEITKEILAKTEGAFVMMAHLMHPNDEPGQLAYIDKYRHIAVKGVTKGTLKACENFLKK
jgi:hypothetical protein